MTGDKACPINPLTMHDVYVEGNIENIAQTIPHDIYRILGFMENILIEVDFSLKELQIYIDLFKEFRDVFAWSYEEIPGIYPRIIKQKIMTYSDAKSV
jgi:hypothetical protein